MVKRLKLLDTGSVDISRRYNMSPYIAKSATDKAAHFAFLTGMVLMVIFCLSALPFYMLYAAISKKLERKGGPQC
jgi:hypothetical protein